MHSPAVGRGGRGVLTGALVWTLVFGGCSTTSWSEDFDSRPKERSLPAKQRVLEDQPTYGAAVEVGGAAVRARVTRTLDCEEEQRVEISQKMQGYQSATAFSVFAPQILGGLLMVGGLVGGLTQELETGPKLGLILGGIGAAMAGLIAGLIAPSVFADDSLRRVDVREESRGTKRIAACRRSPYASQPVQVTVGGTTNTVDTDESGRVDLDLAFVRSDTLPVLGFLDVDGNRETLRVGSSDQPLVARLIDRRRRQGKPPRLALSASFDDSRGNGNRVLDAGETAEVLVRIDNSGGGPAFGVSLRIAAHGPSAGQVRFAQNTLFGDIEAGRNVLRRVQIRATERLPAGSLELRLTASEEMGFGIGQPVIATVPTKAMLTPRLEVASIEIFDGDSALAQGNGNKRIEKGEQIEVRLRITNSGAGEARDVGVELRTSDGSIRFGQRSANIGRLGPKEVRAVSLSFALPQTYRGTEALPIEVSIREQRPRFASAAPLRLFLDRAHRRDVRVALGATGTTVAAPERPAKKKEDVVVAVFDVEDRSGVLGDEERVQLSDYLTSRVTEIGGFTTVPSAEIRQRITEEKREGYKNCYDEKCQVELGKALAAQKSLSSQLLRVGSVCVLSSKLYDLRTEASGVAATSRSKCNVESLIDAVDEVAKKLRGAR